MLVSKTRTHVGNMTSLKASILLAIALPQIAFSFNEKEYVGKAKAPAPATSPQMVNIVEYDSRLLIGGNYAYVTLQPHDHRTFTGNFGGMQALYEYRPMNRIYAGGKFTWRQGKTHGPVGERSLLYFDVHERIGYTYAPAKKDWFATLFTGVGYRYLGQTLNPKVGHSLDFNYNDFYIPVGLLTNFDVTSCFSIGLNYIWMPQVYPTVSIVPLKGARWILTKTLSNFYAELPLTYTFRKRYQLIINPFYEHWQDGHTTAKLLSGAPLGLPGNSYNFYGVELNFGFEF